MNPYIAIARPDHWFKNIFVLPGLAMALLLTDNPMGEFALKTVIGLISTCLTASANYTINEWLDAEFDRHHPDKKNRPSVQGRVQARLVWAEYLILAGLGLGLGTLITREFFFCTLALLFMGIVYNVNPLRTKEVVFLDVLSESVNNPIRLLLGWFIVMEGVFPPSSGCMAYWMGGAFLMAIKRYTEYRHINSPERAALYRQSFKNYTEDILLLSAFFYAMTSAFFLGVFLIKYRVEFLLIFPFLALLFTWYLAIAMKIHSIAKDPEKLYREPGFMLFIGFIVVLAVFTYNVDIPFLHILMERVSF